MDSSHDLQVLRAGDVVVDAGAGFGVSALAFAKVVGSTGSVHAFEAQRVLSQLVCSNAATNQVPASFMAALFILTALPVLMFSLCRLETSAASTRRWVQV